MTLSTQLKGKSVPVTASSPVLKNERASTAKNVLTFIDVLRNRVQSYPHKTAYTFLKGSAESEALTYAELELRVRSFAAFLQSQLPPGTRVLLAYQPGLDFVLAFLACLHAGIVAVPAYAPRRNQKTARLHAIVENAEIEIVLTTAKLGPTFQQFCEKDSLLSNLRWIFTDRLGDASAKITSVIGTEESADTREEANTKAEHWAKQWQQPNLTSDTLAFLQYTSGSTGDPKGVMVTHGNLLHNLSVIADCFGHGVDSQGVIWLPPYHDMGLIGGVLQPIYAGFPVCLMSPVDFLQKPLRWLQAISRYRATTSGGPNFAYELVMRKATPEKLAGLDLSSWEVAFTGAEPIRASTLDRFAEMFAPYGFRKEAFYPCYGMAESTLIISGGQKLTQPNVKHLDAEAFEQGNIVESSPERDDIRTVVGCGQSVMGQTVRIVDPETMQPCQNGQIGEIWVQGKSIAKGYWNRPEETESYFNAYVNSENLSESNRTLPKDGPCLRTGDLGFLHGENLFITGRLKDLIIIRGQNHYPQDIELSVERSHPALKTNSGAAFSVEIKQSERLVIVYEVERSYLRKLNATEIFQQVRKTVTASHALETYAIALVKTHSIPKTSSGKIRRRACRDAFLNGNLNIVADWSCNPRHKSTFQSLQSQIDSVLQQVNGIEAS